MLRRGLGSAIADLAKARRTWQKLLPDLPSLANLKSQTFEPRPTSAPDPGSARPSPLKDVVGFGDNPGALKMLSYVPKQVRPNSAMVVVLHGCTQTARGYDYNSGWSKLADRHGFVLLYAEQKRENNANTCFNWFLPDDITRERGEARSIRQMIERMAADHAIDRRRIFITGLSAGGAMTSVMLATYPEVFAGGAIIAGLPYGSAFNVMEALGAMKTAPRKTAAEWGNCVRAASGNTGPWPAISVWHGAGDRVVSLSNGRAIATQWTNVHGLKETVFSEKNLAPDITQRQWSAPDGQPKVELITITGFAHGTPIDPEGRSGEKSGVAGPFMLDAGLSSTLVMARKWGLAPAV